ncbi:urate hydroxylase PuuD [Alcanivorax sp. ZXX171]|nr:urate hydroxylase PuuD [Alcanivorax sp. ZXX171]
MEAHLYEWANLLIRWLHITVGIAWIGASFYFNWLENQLERHGDKPDGVEGTLWAIHGGGFYHLQKFQVAPARLPERLHWFKWEAYYTWISGMLLLAVVYYLNARTNLIDPSVADLSPLAASLIGLATLALSWLVYDGLCRSPLGRRPVALAAVLFSLLVLLAWGLSQVFSGRGAYIHVGAAIGTCMVANVFFVIIPGQRAMVEAMKAGREPDGARGRAGALRSRHNNYLTLPVLFIMISNHFPSTYGSGWNWLILTALALASIVIRHYFNVRHLPGRHWGLVALGLAGLAAIILATAPRIPDRQAGADTPSVTLEAVNAVVEQRCTACHAAAPSFAGFTAPPKGVRLDSEAAIRQHRDQIGQVAVRTRIMPPGNLTGMTDDERALLERWLNQPADPP